MGKTASSKRRARRVPPGGLSQPPVPEASSTPPFRSGLHCPPGEPGTIFRTRPSGEHPLGEALGVVPRRRKVRQASGLHLSVSSLLRVSRMDAYPPGRPGQRSVSSHLLLWLYHWGLPILLGILVALYLHLR